MTKAPNQPPKPDFAGKLQSVRVGLREDLEVTRHLFRGNPCYIVRDPITMQTQRMEPADYDVFVAIDISRSLGDVFQDLVDRGRAKPEDADSFYQYIMSLHRLSFLQLPVSDDKMLYKRFQAKERAKRKEKLMGFLFLRIPLWNPNAFLEKTIARVRFMFSTPFFLIWVAVMMAAGFVLFRRWDEIAQPAQGLLVAKNLPLMWITLVGLKVFHEFGHAYACKHYGGHVPEMGAFLILFTPCAYMDATASWGFTKKWHRLYVCLGGMYFESMIATVAVFVWALTGPSLLHSAAYNVIFLATVVTILFNINPLMRYDGYYILSDLLEIPNLRAKSAQHVTNALKRIFLGVGSSNASHNKRMGLTLLGYGVAASIYRVALLLAIAALLASKMFLVGIFLATGYIGLTVVKTVLKMTSYLWYAEESAHARRRAVALSLVILILVPAALFVIPVPSYVQAGGVLTAEQEIVIRAREPGFVNQIHVSCDETVEPGVTLAEFSNDARMEAVLTAEANLRASQIRVDAYRVNDLNKTMQEEVLLVVYQKTLEDAQTRVADLTVRSPIHGRVVESIRESDVGSYLDEGDPVATIIDGRWQVRSLLSEEDMAGARTKIGDEVEVRASALPAQTLRGIVKSIKPAGSKTIGLLALTHFGGGDIAIDPTTGESTKPFFEITVVLPEATAPELRFGMTGSIRLPATPEPIGKTVTRRVVRFVNKLLQD